MSNDKVIEFKKGDVIKFTELSSSGNNVPSFNFDISKQLCAELGLRVAVYCTIEKNEGIVMADSKEGITLIEYNEGSLGEFKRGCLAFSNHVLELVKSKEVNLFPIF